MTIAIATPILDPVEFVKSTAGFKKAQEQFALAHADEREQAVANLVRVRNEATDEMNRIGDELKSAEAERDELIPKLTELGSRLDRLRSQIEGRQHRAHHDTAMAEQACQKFALPAALALLERIHKAKQGCASDDAARDLHIEEKRSRLVALCDLEQRAAGLCLLPAALAENEIGEIETALSGLLSN